MISLPFTFKCILLGLLATNFILGSFDHRVKKKTGYGVSWKLGKACAILESVIEIKVRTTKRIEAIDITRKVEELIQGQNVKAVQLFVPHTTCGITVNEGADPSVMRDVLDALERIAPQNFPYRHTEGNADSHIKSVLTGFSALIPVSNGRLILGTWQKVFLLEFDGPRERRVIVNLL